MSPQDKNQNNKGKVVNLPSRPPASVKKAKARKTLQAKTEDKREKPSTAAKPKTQTGQDFFSTKNIMENVMTKNTQKSAAAFDNFAKDASDMTKDYSDAVMKSSTILMKGCENIMGVMMSMIQSSAEKQARLLKEAMSSKTINEFAEVHNKIAQAGFDDFMSGATKISELSVKIMTESSEPVNSQMTKAIQRATESMAA